MSSSSQTSPQQQLTAVPHRGTLILEASFGEQYLLHQLSGELVWLDGTGWRLQFNEAGEGSLVQQGGLSTPVADRLVWCILRHTDGTFRLQHRVTGETVELLTYLQQYSVKWCHVAVLGKVAKAFHFKAARDGARVFWEFRLWQQAISSAESGKLVVHMHAKWSEHVGVSGAAGIPQIHWRRAKPSGQGPDEAAGSWDSIPGFRCLREATVSSFALIWWITYMAARAYQDSKARAINILQSIIELTMPGEFELELAMTLDARDLPSVF